MIVITFQMNLFAYQILEPVSKDPTSSREIYREEVSCGSESYLLSI